MTTVRESNQASAADPSPSQCYCKLMDLEDILMESSQELYQARASFERYIAHDKREQAQAMAELRRDNRHFLVLNTLTASFCWRFLYTLPYSALWDCYFT